MVNVIDKIKVGIKNRRGSNNLSFDNSTTANIGVMQPTMCREMVPDETLHVKVNSLCRLLAMQNPTFGRMSLRHYHTFVPYNRLWRPYDAFIANKPFLSVSQSGQDTKYYSQTPTFYSDTISCLIKCYSDVSVSPVHDLDNPFQLGSVVNDQVIDTPAKLAVLSTVLWRDFLGLKLCSFNDTAESILFDKFNTYGRGLDYNQCGVMNFGDFYACPSHSDTPNEVTITYDDNPLDANLICYNESHNVITRENADLIVCNDNYAFFFKFKPILKKIRQIFIGLGYQFNPFAPVECDFNPFKLYAYYASCFELFYPKREINFQQTSCWFLTQICDYFNLQLSTASNNTHDSQIARTKWLNFIFVELPQLTYYLPMDYYSASVPRVTVEDNSTQIQSLYGAPNNTSSIQIADPKTNNPAPVTASVVAPVVNNTVNPIALRMAMTMLRFANKNTVIGRSIRDYLRVHFGITDTIDEVSSPVRFIGSSRINITISDVMSMADTANGDSGSSLGSFAGKGIGYGESERFDYKADTFGVWLTITVLVPESGFFQGYLRENRHKFRYDFFHKDFDALGYQITERGEVSHDYTASSTTGWSPRSLAPTAGFGFMPRYSEYKISQNIVNGDLSLRGLRNSMSSFTIDRRLPTENLHIYRSVWDSEKKEVKRTWVFGTPAYYPTTVFDGFRAIDQTDVVGDYNRIFTYMGNDYDHFIIHNLFDVRAVAPWKPLSSSFDTFDSDDDTSVNVQKA